MPTPGPVMPTPGPATPTPGPATPGSVKVTNGDLVFGHLGNDYEIELYYNSNEYETLNTSEVVINSKNPLYLLEHVNYNFIISPGTQRQHPPMVNNTGVAGPGSPVPGLTILENGVVKTTNSTPLTQSTLQFKLDKSLHYLEFYIVCRITSHYRMVQKFILLNNPSDTLCNIKYSNIVGYGTNNIYSECNTLSKYIDTHIYNPNAILEYNNNRRMCDYLSSLDSECNTKKCNFSNSSCN